MSASTPLLSVIIPAHNEAANLPRLVAEVGAAFPGWRDLELIIVDDCSDDDSASVLAGLQRECPVLRVLRHDHRSGQSQALLSGARAARGHWLGTLDGDGQNDPADLPKLLAHVEAIGDPGLKLVQGWRVQRRDSGLKRLSSKVANAVRSALLGDSNPDSGCGIRVIERQALLRLPPFDHMHRFLPALVSQAGWRVESLPVGHRPRLAGRSHYGLFGRLAVGIVDLFGVAWLGRRTQCPEVIEQPRDRGGSDD